MPPIKEVKIKGYVDTAEDDAIDENASVSDSNTKTSGEDFGVGLEPLITYNRKELQR